MGVFIRLKSKERENLFGSVKEELGVSWNKIYPLLGVSRAMFFNYLSGKYDLPINLFNNLEKIGHVRITKYSTIRKEKYIEKKIKSPPLNSHLAELLGALSGDGHISDKNSYEVSITCSGKDDCEYIKHLKPIFETLFCLNFKVYADGSKIRLKTYSKNLVLFLNKEFGLPLGKKKGFLRIPEKVKTNKKLLLAYIRGLFDTDGSIYFRRNNEPAVEIISMDKRFLKEIETALRSLGFLCGTSGKNLYIYDKSMIKKFFHEVKPANSKHLKKYRMYSN